MVQQVAADGERNGDEPTIIQRADETRPGGENAEGEPINYYRGERDCPAGGQPDAG